jgi:hypothetical protein
MGQQVAKLALSHFGLRQQPDRIGEAAKVIQEGSIKLLGIDDIVNAVSTFKTVYLFINGPVEKFFPSFELLLSLFGISLHSVLPIIFNSALPPCGLRLVENCQLTI